MPYCFIWASFTLNGETIFHTRWNNGSVEKFIGVRKRKENTFLKMLPAQYCAYVYPVTIGSIKEYINFQKKKKKGVAHANDEDEEHSTEAKDIWQRQFRSNNNIVQVSNRQALKVGFYQAPKCLDFPVKPSKRSKKDDTNTEAGSVEASLDIGWSERDLRVIAEAIQVPAQELISIESHQQSTCNYLSLCIFNLVFFLIVSSYYFISRRKSRQQFNENKKRKNTRSRLGHNRNIAAC